MPLQEGRLEEPGVDPGIVRGGRSSAGDAGQVIPWSDVPPEGRRLPGGPQEERDRAEDPPGGVGRQDEVNLGGAYSRCCCVVAVVNIVAVVVVVIGVAVVVFFSVR